MKFHLRIYAAHFINLLFFVLISSFVLLFRVNAIYNNEDVVQDNVYADDTSRTTHILDGRTQYGSGHNIMHDIISEHKRAGSSYDDTDSFIALMHVWYHANLYLSIHFILNRMSLHTQDYVNSLFHPPKTF